MTEPTNLEAGMRKQFRLVLNLGKYQIIEREGNTIKVALGGSTTMTIPLPIDTDVRPGDILTFYTEVPYANPKPTPQQ